MRCVFLRQPTHPTPVSFPFLFSLLFSFSTAFLLGFTLLSIFFPFLFLTRARTFFFSLRFLLYAPLFHRFCCAVNNVGYTIFHSLLYSSSMITTLLIWCFVAFGDFILPTCFRHTNTALLGERGKFS